MKKYLYYSQSSNKNRWPYFKDKFKYPSLKAVMKARESGSYIDTGSIHIAFIAFTHKKDFIELVSYRSQSPKNWIKERIHADIANEWCIEQCKQHPDSIVVFIDNVGWGSVPDKTIIEVIPIGKNNE